MKSSLYSIMDIKAKKVSEPFSCPNDEVAKRNFLLGCFEAGTPPQDCVLWHVADFVTDDENADVFSVVNVDRIRCIQPTIEEIEGYSKMWRMMNGIEEEKNA